jgi:hypothetical protein
MNQSRVHEANIREGEKTVHVVFKYLSRSLAVETGAWGRAENAPVALLHHPVFQYFLVLAPVHLSYS